MANKRGQAAMLLSIMALPLLIIAWLYLFGQNHYDLPVYYADGLRGQTKGRPHTLPDFSLLDQQGRPVTRQSLRGRIVLLDVLPLHENPLADRAMAQTARLQEEFEKEPRIGLYSLVLATGPEIGEEAHATARRMEADPKRWQFLYGRGTEAYAFADQGLGLAKRDAAGVLSYPDPARRFLIDTAGRIRGIYPSSIDVQTDTAVIEARVLLQQGR